MALAGLRLQPAPSGGQYPAMGLRLAPWQMGPCVPGAPGPPPAASSALLYPTLLPEGGTLTLSSSLVAIPTPHPGLPAQDSPVSSVRAEAGLHSEQIVFPEFHFMWKP